MTLFLQSHHPVWEAMTSECRRGGEPVACTLTGPRQLPARASAWAQRPASEQSFLDSCRGVSSKPALVMYSMALPSVGHSVSFGWLWWGELG